MTNDLIQRVLALGEEIDAAVLPLCERYGFGAVMDSAATQWAKCDPEGALTIGPPAQGIEARQGGDGTAPREARKPDPKGCAHD